MYWFYVVATFATVAFLAYLYDLLVRRREAAHPVRETRGFSRAQTGDLVTAVLPLTWSATMVMHASTHSINFDENTAGAAFSFTVIAYQWGWNYYFPRDVVSQMEAAPRVVGRGRVVCFSPSPQEGREAAAADLWAVRATLGARHASRTGRLNAPGSALALALPTDVPAGALAALPRGAQWRAAAALNPAALGDAAPSPRPPAPGGGFGAGSPVWGLDTATAFVARPSAFIAGDRIALGVGHYRPSAPAGRLGAGFWAGLRGARSPLVAPAPSLAPALGNLGGAASEGRPVYPLAAVAAGLDALRGGRATAPAQHLLWTGPDAVTGAGFTALASTEDMGWLTPVPAREASTRAALGVAQAWAGRLPACGTAGRAPGALLAPFDVAARSLWSHVGGGLPLAWVGASAALEADIGPDSAASWAVGLAPDLSAGALGGAAAGLLGTAPSLGVRAAALPRSEGPAFGLSNLGLAPVASAGAAPRGVAPLGRPVATAPRPRQARAAAGAGAAPAASLRPRAPAPRQLGAGAAPLCGGAAPARAHLLPGLAGLGLDEGRLVRGGAARIGDPALVAGKLDAPTGPRLALPLGPTGLVALGWSASASVAAFPSFKVARGGLLRRPMSGLRPAPGAAAPLVAPLAAPFLGKVGAPIGASRLRLWAHGAGAGAPAGSALDVARASWAATWAFVGPAPTEDLDPAFINTV